MEKRINNILDELKKGVTPKTYGWLEKNIKDINLVYSGCTFGYYGVDCSVEGENPDIKIGDHTMILKGSNYKLIIHNVFWCSFRDDDLIIVSYDGMEEKNSLILKLPKFSIY